MKLGDVKKRWMLESSAIAGVLAVLSVLAYYMTSVTESFSMEVTELEGRVSKLVSDKTQLSAQYENVQKYMSLYDIALERNPANGSYASREIAAAKFKEYNDRYHMLNLKLTMTPPKELTGAVYKRKNAQMLSSDVAVDFDTITDDQAYSLLSAMDTELLGVQRVNSFKLTRLEKLSDKALQAINDKGTYALIKVELRNAWLGFKQLDTDTAKDAKTKAK